MAGVNFDLLMETMRFVSEHPDRWEQQSWSCGSTRCFAGWAVALAGYTIDPMGPSMCFDPNGKCLKIEHAAREVLGLSVERALQLFDAMNTMHDLERIVDDILIWEL